MIIRLIQPILTCLLVMLCCGSVLAKEEPTVVSLSPMITELICYLGAEEQLIGRSSACDYPQSAVSKPVAGDVKGPVLEVLARLQPDYLICSDRGQQSFYPRLKALGIKVVEVKMTSLADYRSTVAVIGDLFGKNKAAIKEQSRIDNELKKLKDDLAQHGLKNKLAVYVEIWGDPIMTAGEETFIGEYIRLAGGRNIADGLSGTYITCSSEWVIRSMPDIIICPAMGKNSIDAIAKRPGWRLIPAVKTKQVFGEVPRELLYRLGPRSFDGIHLLKKIISSASGDKS